MRYFIALEIPQDCKKQLECVQQEVRQIVPQARLTDNGKLHLTVAFIGEKDESIINSLTKVMEKAVAGISPFEVSPAYLDGFPNLHNPHTLWVGVKGDIDKLFVIRERVKDGLIGLGVEVDERRYIPHIAIAKLSSNYQLSAEQEAKFQQLMLEQFEPIQITSLKLFESIPEQGFHKHNTISEVSLR